MKDASEFLEFLFNVFEINTNLVLTSKYRNGIQVEDKTEYENPLWLIPSYTFIGGNETADYLHTYDLNSLRDEEGNDVVLETTRDVYDAPILVFSLTVNIFF
jgi:hypothetical protein